jgi:hypothetical protein
MFGVLCRSFLVDEDVDPCFGDGPAYKEPMSEEAERLSTALEVEIPDERPPKSGSRSHPKKGGKRSGSRSRSKGKKQKRQKDKSTG